MRIESRLEEWNPARIRAALAGLPAADGYRLVVKPLRYRTRPHLTAYCSFDDHAIVVQVPEPWRAFWERVPYRAKRIRGRGFRFRWEFRDVRFRTKREVIRFLYLHEWYHWYLRERLGKKSAAETACDRFALAHFRRRTAIEIPEGAATARIG